MDKLLITGGAGFVGVNLVNALLKLGCQITVLDNESVGDRNNLPLDKIDFIHADIIDPVAVDNAVKACDTVVHLAAATNVMESIKLPAENFQTNVVGIMNILESMRKHDIKRIINASTGGAIIGDVTPPVHEEMVAAPISPYGASKLCAEGYLSAYAGSYGIQSVSLRFSNVYGPHSHNKTSVVALFIKEIMAGETLQLFGGGEQTRDFIYIDDIVQGIVKSIQSTKSGVYQLGTNQATSIKALVELLAEVMSDEYPVKEEICPARAGEVINNYCSYAKAKKELGFVPQFALKEGLKETFAWFKKAKRDVVAAAK